MRARGLIAAAVAAVVLAAAPGSATAAGLTGQQRAVLYGIARDTWR
jgi:hypothetical protein